MLSLTVFWEVRAAQDHQQLRYPVVYADAEGITHFRDDYLPWQKAAGNPPGGFITPYLDA